MSRDIATGTATALIGPQLSPIGLVELDFSSGTVRLWTGVGELTWNGQTWNGTAPLGRIGAIEETTELKAVGTQLELSGVDAAVLEIALAEDWQGRAALIYYGVLDLDRQFVGEPFQIFGGQMDQMTLVEGKEASITLSCESDLIDLERTRARRYTSQDQRAEYPGDAGMDQVASLQELVINLPRT